MENKKNKINENVLRIIFILLFLIILFVQGKFSKLMSEGVIPLTAMSGINGIISQIQVLIAVAMTVMVRKKGCLNASIMCVINAVYTLVFGVIVSRNLGALPGVITPFITVFICRLINFYSMKAFQAQSSLEVKNQNLLMANDEMLREGEKLSRMVYSDALTGLSNKRMIYKKIGEFLTENENAGFTIIFANIDNFSEINEKYSQDTGDVVLSTIGYRLHNFCGDSAVVGRVGGDQFAIVLNGTRTKEAVSSYISDLKSEVCEAISAKDKIIDLTMCVGVAMCPQNGKSAKELMDNSEKALNTAKAQGEGSVVFFS